MCEKGLEKEEEEEKDTGGFDLSELLGIVKESILSYKNKKKVKTNDIDGTIEKAISKTFEIERLNNNSIYNLFPHEGELNPIFTLLYNLCEKGIDCLQDEDIFKPKEEHY